MKKLLFLIAVAAAFTLSSFKAQSQILTITSVEKTADGNKVYFEIIVDTLKFTPALLVSTSYNKKTNRYDWGGNPFPYEVITIGNVTTGYFLDEPIQGSRKRYYALYYWDYQGNVILSPVYEYNGK
jgi:hypothetical protein